MKNLVITRAVVTENANNASAGTIIQADRKKLVIACGKDALEIAELIPPGKKAMSGANFLNGCREVLTGRNLMQE